jgi:hypothetical protein
MLSGSSTAGRGMFYDGIRNWITAEADPNPSVSLSQLLLELLDLEGCRPLLSVLPVSSRSGSITGTFLMLSDVFGSVMYFVHTDRLMRNWNPNQFRF